MRLTIDQCTSEKHIEAVDSSLQYSVNLHDHFPVIKKRCRKHKKSVVRSGSTYHKI
jgi:hypothetical protein